jgi:hypothetical protein
MQLEGGGVRISVSSQEEKIEAMAIIISFFIVACFAHQPHCVDDYCIDTKKKLKFEG